MKVKGRQNCMTSQNVFSRLSPGPVVTGEGSEPPGQPEWTQPVRAGRSWCQGGVSIRAVGSSGSPGEARPAQSRKRTCSSRAAQEGRLHPGLCLPALCIQPVGSGRGSKGQGARLSWQPGPGQRQLDSRRSTRTQLQAAPRTAGVPTGLAGNCVQSSSARPEGLFFVIRYLQTMK